MATKAVGMSARLRAMLAVVASLAVLAGGLLAGLAAVLVGGDLLGGAQEVRAQEIKAQEVGAFDTGGMELLSIDVGVVGQGTVRIQLRLPGVVLDDDELIVNIHGPIDSESHFLDTTQGESLGGVLQSQMIPVSELEVDSAGVVELLLNINQPVETVAGATTSSVTAADTIATGTGPPSVRLVADGVYPLTIELRTQRQQLVARIGTHIVHVATSDSGGSDSSRGNRNNRLSVLLIADLTGTALASTALASTGATGTAPTSTGPTGTVSAWLDVLSSHADVPILAKITPQWLSESSNLDSAQRLAQVTQEQSADSQLQLVHNPYYPINQIALADAGLNDELDHLFIQGAQTLAAYAALAPPTLFVSRETMAAQQLAVGAARGARTAVIPVEALAVSAVDESAAAGPAVTGPAVTGPAVTGLSGGALVGFPFRAPIEVRVPVEELAATASNASGELTSSIRTLLIDHLAPPQLTDSPDAAAQRVLAHLATIALDGSRISKSDEVVVLDLTAAEHSPELAAAVLTGLDQLTLVQPVSAEQAFSKPLLSGDGAPSSEIFLATASATDGLGGGVNSGVNQTYFDTSRQLSSYRSMIRDEDAVTYNELVQDLLSTLASDAVPAQQENQWQQISSFVKLQASQLEATSSTSVRLTSRSAQVPFSFQNNGAIPLRVELRLVSDKLTVENFDDGESTTLVLQPGVTTREFGIRTLSSGAFVVDLELHSPDGNLLIGSIPIVMQSTAPTWAGFLLATGATAFLLIWWIVDSRRRRLNRAKVDALERNA